jgi:CRISPR-associated endonuclease/helicase Cas3
MTFQQYFAALTDNDPFPWQEDLYENWFAKGNFPDSCNLPTGLGKTSVMAIWLIALANKCPNMPRRLVYVVNRRTVVDQATDEAAKMAEKLMEPGDDLALVSIAEKLHARCAVKCDSPLAVSTLRGQFADNGDWLHDPARAAIVVATVDMAGSRLLFNAYGRGFKTRPLHAGMIGQDCLIVHDEAHLEPAFQQLLEAVRREQREGRARDPRPIVVIELTATSRSGGDPFRLKDEERTPQDPVPQNTPEPLRTAWKRITAKKGISFHGADDDKAVAFEIGDVALEDRFKDSGQAILVFVRTIDSVKSITERLRKVGHEPVTLTGTMRGKERDDLVEHPKFQRFLPPSRRKKGMEPTSGTVYLVCTSAGEVGVDISADHLICDLSTYESMAQRLGRVNRFGDGDAMVEVVYSEELASREFRPDEQDRYERRIQLTLPLLQSLPKRADGRCDASPQALGALPKERRQAAFAPTPEILPATDILFDAWALTSIREPLGGRPPIADWLHGVAEWQPPETQVAWREEVELMDDKLLRTNDPEELLDDYPLKPQELLRDRTDRVFKTLQGLSADVGEKPVWIVDTDGGVVVTNLVKLASGDKEDLNDVTVILPPTAGGLSPSGMFDGSKLDPEPLNRYDVADHWFVDKEKSISRRRRLRSSEAVPDSGVLPAGMRLVRVIDLQPDSDEDEAETLRYWLWYERPRSADDASAFALVEQELSDHLSRAGKFAAALCKALDLDKSDAAAIEVAASLHDLGKARVLWQRSIGNHDANRVLAKSGRRMRPLELGKYRHEFGSLLDMVNRTRPAEYTELKDDSKMVALHTTATHHGRGRPCFSNEEAFDPLATDVNCREMASDVVLRFAELQRRFGRWGLAWLESMVRAADALASQKEDENEVA